MTLSREALARLPITGLASIYVLTRLNDRFAEAEFALLLALVRRNLEVLHLGIALDFEESVTETVISGMTEFAKMQRFPLPFLRLTNLAIRCEPSDGGFGGWDTHLSNLAPLFSLPTLTTVTCYEILYVPMAEVLSWSSTDGGYRLKDVMPIRPNITALHLPYSPMSGPGLVELLQVFSNVLDLHLSDPDAIEPMEISIDGLGDVPRPHGTKLEYFILDGPNHTTHSSVSPFGSFSPLTRLRNLTTRRATLIGSYWDDRENPWVPPPPLADQLPTNLETLGITEFADFEQLGQP